MVFSLMMFVFVMAGTANTKAEDWPKFRAMLWATGLGGAICVAAAIWLMSTGRPLTATAIGGLPIAVFLGLLIYAALPR